MKSQTVLLKSILAYRGLSSGYSFRGKIKNVHNGGVRVIQLKDFENNYSSIGDHCTMVDSDKIKDKYYLETGDVLFISKGANNFSVVFKEDGGVPTIASSALFVLKINKEKASPEFIAWYLNQSIAQNYLKSNESGTYATSINRTALENVPINLPAMDVQCKIAKVADLYNKEQVINSRITELKNTLITNQLIKSL